VARSDSIGRLIARRRMKPRVGRLSRGAIHGLEEWPPSVARAIDTESGLQARLNVSYWAAGHCDDTKKTILSQAQGKKLPQLPLLREAYELGKGFGISDDNFKPAWEKEWVRKIIIESDL
jgi:hypothetical protein